MRKTKLPLIWFSCLSILVTLFSLSAQSAQALSNRTADSIIELGSKYMGTPYDYGAPTGSTRAFDCSSFTQYIFGRNGIRLPRTSSSQAKVGRYISSKQLQKGDLLFFSTSYSKGKIAHVGVYAGHGYVLHTYGKPGVTITNLKTNAWWRNHYITARRL